MLNESINIKGIEIIDNHPTTLKQRIYSDGEQVARLDTEKIIDWQPDSNMKYSYSDYDIIILSDYNKGALNNSWFSINDLDNVIVDPKKDNFNHSYYKTKDLLYRLAYHDIYYLYPHIKNSEIEDIIPIDVDNKLQFKVKFNDISVEFGYDTNYEYVKFHDYNPWFNSDKLNLDPGFSSKGFINTIEKAKKNDEDSH